MKRILLIGLFGLMLAGCDRQPEDIVAKVDGEAIVKADLENALRFKFNIVKAMRYARNKDKKYDEERLWQKFSEQYRRTIKKEVLIAKMFEKACAKRKLAGSAEERAQLEARYARMFTKDASKYDKVLETTRAIGFEREFIRHVEAEAAKMAYSRTINEDLDKVTEEDIDRRIEEIKATNQWAVAKNNETYVLASNVLARAKSGEDFGKLADLYSQDSEDDKEEHGDLGAVLLSGVASYLTIKPSYSWVFKANDGEISDFLATSTGFDIVKVVASLEKDSPDEPDAKHLQRIQFKIYPEIPIRSRDEYRRSMERNKMSNALKTDILDQLLKEVKVEVVGCSSVEDFFHPKEVEE